MDAVLRVTAAAKKLFEKLRGEEAMNDVLREIMMDDILAAEEQGEATGEMISLIKQVKRKLEKGKTPEEIAIDLDEDLKKVKWIYDATVSADPDSTPKDIFLKLKNNISA